VQRRVGIRAIEREIAEAVQRARQLLVEAARPCARRRLFEQALSVVVVPAVAVGLAKPLQLVQEQGLGK